MQVEFESCYRALRARDPRFDGRFFVGVASTRVYCRPVCRVRAPKRENCRFFPSAAAAEAAGYRPCLRCRPELAPGFAAVDADGRLVQAAGDLIENNLGSEQGLAGVAARLGVTSRHLRRVFQAYLGASPVQFARTQRLLLAKRLLTDTSMSVTDVARAGGFGSRRRCEALLRSRYRLTPSAVRGDMAAQEPGDALAFQLGFRPPLDWTALLAFLERRAIAGVEQIDGSVYRRTVQIERTGGQAGGWVAVGLARRTAHLEVRVSASLVGSLPSVFARIKRQFDLGCDPEEVSSALGVLAAGRPGLRVPGAFDGFEIAVRAVLGQQVTVKAARTLAGRFATAFGEPCATPFDGLNRLFPDP
ncbi:MAG TPA: AlkA N-terminal domain-containing protein, partial [Burkholderiales bacterium]|nr:AlkA N-terminal domain-containing protein [Burkholderiales bacterium]